MHLSLLWIVLMTVAASLCAQAENVKTISADRLPAKAKKFITDNFPGKRAAAAETVKNGASITYRANLSDNATKVEFSKMGDWSVVEVQQGAVPNKVVPEKILKRSKELYKEGKIMRISKSKAGYEVKLSMGTTLKFNANCTLTEMVF